MDDEPSGWTDADDARAQLEGLSHDHPSRVAVFFSELFLEDRLDLDAASSLVTPESRSDWSDFEGGGRFYLDQAVSTATHALRPTTGPDVAYVKIIADSGQYVFDHTQRDVLAYVNLVWRPSLGGWKIHSIGQPIAPPRLPRENLAWLSAPTFDNDVSVAPPPEDLTP